MTFFSELRVYISELWLFISGNYGFFLAILQLWDMNSQFWEYISLFSPSKLDFNLQLWVISHNSVKKRQNCEIKSRNNLFLFFIQWQKRASIIIHNNSSSSDKVFWSESGEKSASDQAAFTRQNSSEHICEI